MNILVIQPGFPAEIPYFVRGLKQMGATVLGVGDQPKRGLPKVAAQGLDAYLQVGNFWDAKALIQALRSWDVPVKLDRVECLWEVGMELAAEVRQAFGLPGLTPEQTQLFRDKHLMRKALDRAGVRNPRHASASSSQQVQAAAEYVGYPLIIKPIAGAGSANTYRVDNPAMLAATLKKLRKVQTVVVEEFVRGTEFTFDTICAGGKILFHNIEMYRPDMLTARTVEHISPQTIVLRDRTAPAFQKAFEMGAKVITALGFDTGFTHMEWFLTPEGEVVFGEIAGRPPGGFSGEMMNYALDADVYRAWAEAVIHGRISQDLRHRYNVAIVFKRAAGKGIIQRVEGEAELRSALGPMLIKEALVPVGSRRRNWKQTLLSDGYWVLRHPDFDTAIKAADLVAEKLRMYAQ